MKNEIRTYVLSLLESYRECKRQIALLHYEIKHPARITPAEAVEAMTFAKGTERGYTSTGHVSDKTMYIALNYREAAENLNAGVVDSIVSKLVPLERETDRLEHYVALLDTRQAAVIRRYYFERLSWDRICSEMQATPKTLRKVRDAAIDALAEMYEFAAPQSD